MQQKQHLLRIFETNSFAADGGSVVVTQASRINHSCTPNVYHNWNAASNALTVHAVRDIEPGEEILTSYIQVCVWQDVRQKWLNRYGFLCDCAACDLRTEKGRQSEARRRRMCVANRVVVAKYLSPDRAELYSDEVRLEAIVEIIGILKEEGIVNMELGHRYVLWIAII